MLWAWLIVLWCVGCDGEGGNQAGCIALARMCPLRGLPGLLVRDPLEGAPPRS